MAIMAQQKVAGIELTCLHPASPHHPEGMLIGRADDVSGHVQMPNATRAVEALLDFLQFHRAVGIVFIPRPDLVADAGLFDGLRTMLPKDRRTRCEAGAEVISDSGHAACERRVGE